MALRTKILDDIKIAMKARDAEKLSVLRFVNAEIKNKEIAVRPNELTDEDVMKVLKKYLKQRKEAADQYAQANRQDLVDQETAEAAIIEPYLPEMLSEEQLKPIVAEVIKTLGASTMRDMGGVMKEVTAKTNGLADGKMVSTLVKAALS